MLDTGIFDKHDEIVVVANSRDGSIIYANESALRFYGYSKEEFFTMTLEQLHSLHNHKANHNKQCIQKLELEKEKYRQLINLSNDGLFIIDFEGNLLEWSKHAASMLGYSDDEMKNLRLIDWNKELSANEVKEKMLLASKHPISFKTKHTRKDGTTIDVCVKSRVLQLPDGKQIIYASATDITAQEQTLNKLSQTSQKLSLTLESSLLGSWDWDMQNDAVVWDKHCYEMLGYKHNEIEMNSKKFLYMIYPLDAIKMEKVIDKALKDGESFQIEFRAKKKDGSYIWIEGRGRVVNYDTFGKPIRMVGIHNDINKKKTYEQTLQKEIAQQVLQIRQKDAQLIHQSKMADMGEMLAAIIHQWTQPLNLIALTASTIEIAESDDELLQIQNSILQKVDFMSQTIRDFVDFFKTDKKSVQFYPCDILKKVIKMFEELFTKCDITITIYASECKKVFGYESEFMQVLLIILSNARDALLQTDPQTKHIVCSFAHTETTLQLSIKDNAGGIDESLLPYRLFEQRVTTKKKGTGIGLSIAKAIICDHFEGSIYAKNDEDGAVFEIFVPIVKES